MIENKIDLDQEEAYEMDGELTRLRQDNKETPKVYVVPSGRMGYLKERMVKLQARARRLGCTEPQVTEVGFEDRPEMRQALSAAELKSFGDKARGNMVPTGVVNRVHFILIEGEAPKFSGWAFVAGVDAMPEAGNFVRVVPGQVLPEAYRKMEPHCDHCRTARNRIKHYVVKNEATGEHKMVGSSCLRDFLGHVSPDNIANLAQFWSEISGVVEEAERGGSGGSDYLDLQTFLSYVACAIRLHGWKSRGQVKNEGCGCATSDRALDGMFHKEKDCREGCLHPVDEDRALADRAIEWAKTIDPKSDFEHNLSVVAQCEVLPGSGAGVAAAMIFCYKREVEKELLREKKARMFSASTYVGEIKERRDFEVVVVGQHDIDGTYGTVSIYKLLDRGGNLLTWFSSSAALKEGESYVLKGTVKAHEEYKGTKQTIITRCKVVKSLGEVKTA